MTRFEFDDHLIAYHESGNDYRYAFTREEAEEIKQAIDKKTWIEEVKKLLKEEMNG